MTLAVIITIWVSLSLFGAALLARQQVDLMKGRWYDKIEISVFLCTKDLRRPRADPGQDVTQEQKNQIQQILEANPDIAPGRGLLRDQEGGVRRSSRSCTKAARSRTAHRATRCRSPSGSS